jgi:hypothetical protein
MRVRLYSLPHWAGLENVGFTLYISYVFSSGGTVQCRTSSYDGSYGHPLLPNVMGFPRSDEIFTLQGVNGPPFQTGDVIQLLASNNRFVGIDHDEEDRTDSVVANDAQPDLSDTFAVTVVQDTSTGNLLSSVSGLDPCGPPQAITLMGPGQNFLRFPVTSDGPMDVDSTIVGSSQTFAVDFLPPSHKTPWRRL